MALRHMGTKEHEGEGAGVTLSLTKSEAAEKAEMESAYRVARVTIRSIVVIVAADVLSKGQSDAANAARFWAASTH
jgi:hypothetical protein